MEGAKKERLYGKFKYSDLDIMAKLAHYGSENYFIIISLKNLQTLSLDSNYRT